MQCRRRLQINNHHTLRLKCAQSRVQVRSMPFCNVPYKLRCQPTELSASTGGSDAVVCGLFKRTKVAGMPTHEPMHSTETSVRCTCPDAVRSVWCIFSGCVASFCLFKQKTDKPFMRFGCVCVCVHAHVHMCACVCILSTYTCVHSDNILRAHFPRARD